MVQYHTPTSLPNISRMHSVPVDQQLHQQSAPNLELGEFQQSIVHSERFLQTIIQGVSQPLAGEVLFFWLDFISGILPSCKKQLLRFLLPIMQCLFARISRCRNPYSFQASKEMLEILTLVRSFLQQCMIPAESEMIDSFGRVVPNSVNSEKTLLRSFLRGFSSPGVVVDPVIETRNEFVKALPELLNSIAAIWKRDTHTDEELENKFLIQDFIGKMISGVFKMFPFDICFSLCSLLEEFRNPTQVLSRVHNIPEIISELLLALPDITPSIIIGATTEIVSTTLQKNSPIQM
jgi:hypothetical protein